jgi:hypothetical protein
MWEMWEEKTNRAYKHPFPRVVKFDQQLENCEGADGSSAPFATLHRPPLA